MKKAKFFRKMIDLNELKEFTERETEEGNEFKIFKVIELSSREYRNFTERLLEDRDFIA